MEYQQAIQVNELLKLPERRKKKPTPGARGEIFGYIFNKLSAQWLGKKPMKVGWLAMKLSHLKEQDLYYLKSVCDDAERQGYTWAAIFWKRLNENK